MSNYIVKPGDCILSIAQAAGHFWRVVWDDPQNEALRRLRSDPNVLQADDVVFVPDLRPKTENGQTEKRHRFRRVGTPGKLRLRLLEPSTELRPEPQGASVADQEQRHVETEDALPDEAETLAQPRANVPYRLVIDSEWLDGKTDGEGRLEVGIPAGARHATLVLHPGTELEERIELELGTLDPISEIVGVKQRLSNLGIECGDRSPEHNEGLRAALRHFQSTAGLEPTGELTAETRDAIRSRHGS